MRASGFSGHSSLYALPGQKNLFDATPLDICRFLVFMDSKGNTQVHKTGCPHLGQRGIFSCQCPLRLAYSTVHSYIGKLGSIFSDIVRQRDWNRTLLLGNPAFDLLAKQYLKEVTAEQLRVRITPKQAVPLFPDKLLLLSLHLEKRLPLPSLSLAEIFTARDEAFFKALFFSGDRVGDLGQVKTSELARFPNEKGFLFNHVWSKTLRDGASNLFGMRRTLIQPFALSEQLKLMWRLHEYLVLACPVDICFVPLIIRAILLIPPF